MSEDLARLDRQLAETRGAYFGFQTAAGPERTEDYGLSPAAEVDRLLDRYAGPATRFLDVGCGAGQTLCRLGARVREAYAKSIKYSLDSMVSWVREYGDDNLVLVVLGDHQPAPVVVGDTAGRDVPITIVSRDPAVLDRVAGWGWNRGLEPVPQAPVWPMDSFRDRLFGAFGPTSG